MELTPTRLLTLVCIVAVAYGGWRFVAQPMQSGSNDAAAGAVAIVSQGDLARLVVAETNLATRERLAGTFSGATMPAGVRLVRADEVGYCIELTGAGSVSHVVGPGGVATVGRC